MQTTGAAYKIIRQVQAAVVLALALLLGPPATASDLVIHVGGDGPATLQAALTEVRKQAVNADTAAEIEIDAPELRGEAIVFRWPAHLQSLEIAGKGAATVMQGADYTSTWLTIIAAIGRDTNIHIHDLTIRHYWTALSIEGDRERPDDGWNGGNTIERVTFDDIGARDGGAPSTAVLRLINSRDNVIAHNLFTNVGNAATCGLIHALYLAHHSSKNRIDDNTIRSRCMDPFRWRDDSNGNVFKGNTMRGHAPNGLYTEWFCKTDCTKQSPECPSHGNVFIKAGRPTPGKDTTPPGPVSAACR